MLFKNKKGIPPGLLRVIKTEKISKKTLLLIGLSALIVAAGFVTVFLYNQYLIPELKSSSKSVQKDLMAKIEKPQEKEFIQAKIEQTTEQTKSLESEPPKQNPKGKLGESISETKTKPREKSIPLNQGKNPKHVQISTERKTGKSSEVPFEQFNTETAKAADYLYRAQDLETKGNYIEAISEYKEYLKITGKKDSKILNKLATLYLLVGNLKEASYYAEMALQQTPDSVTVLVNYGVINAKMGNLQKAEECFRKVISISPENKSALYNLALLKEKNKEYKEALHLYEKLYKLGDPQAQEAIERVRAYIRAN
ncbi:MAG: tetratricopeptide repeat protein [Thermodesulfovibrio sp.]|nr:tetratricopeptide repeat protein [Thermodesulfovibrio sp.]